MFVQILSAPFAVLIDVFSYLASGIICLLRRESNGEEKKKESGTNCDKEVPTSVFSGLSFILHSASLRAITLSAAHFNFFSAGFAGTVIYFMVNELGFSSFQVGLTSVTSGVLGVVSASCVERVIPFYSTRRLYSSSYIISGVFGLLVPVSLFLHSRLGAFVFVSLGLGVWAFAIVVNLVMSETIKLNLTPKRLVGEVSSSIRWLSIGVEPAGALIGGMSATCIGTGPWLMCASIGLASASVWVYFVGNLKEVSISSTAKSDADEGS